MNQGKVWLQTHKLKEKLVNFFGKEITFWQSDYKSEIVYSSALDTGEAVEAAFEAATSENLILEEATSILCRLIQDAFSGDTMAAISKLFNSGVISPPSSLVYFLSLIFLSPQALRYHDFHSPLPKIFVLQWLEDDGKCQNICCWAWHCDTGLAVPSLLLAQPLWSLSILLHDCCAGNCHC